MLFWGALKMQNLPNHKICYREAQLSSGQPGLKLTFEQLDCSSCKFTKEQNIFTFITKNFLAFLFGKLLPCFSFCHFMKSSLASLLSSLYYDLFWFIALTNSFITLCKSTVAEVWYTLNHSKALIKIDEYLRYDLQNDFTTCGTCSQQGSHCSTFKVQHDHWELVRLLCCLGTNICI